MRYWLPYRSRVHRANLDDVAQEVYQRLLRYSDKDLVEYPQTYFYRIVTNVINEWHKCARSNGSHERARIADLRVEPDDEPDGPEQTHVKEQVRIAVSKLTPRQYEILVLHINEDLTYKQIAARLKLTPRSIRRDIARAYAHLRCELGTAELDTISHVSI